MSIESLMLDLGLNLELNIKAVPLFGIYVTNNDDYLYVMDDYGNLISVTDNNFAFNQTSYYRFSWDNRISDYNRIIKYAVIFGWFYPVNGKLKMKLSIDYMRKSIKDNQMDYVTIKSINQMDYNKINLIIALCTGFAPCSDDIYNLVESYNNQTGE